CANEARVLAVPTGHSCREIAFQKNNYIITAYMLVEFLKNNIKYGRLLLSLPDGTEHRLGNGGPEAHWRFNNETMITRILRDPDMELGETYMEGGWDAGEPGLRRLFEIFMHNFREDQAK